MMCPLLLGSLVSVPAQALAEEPWLQGSRFCNAKKEEGGLWPEQAVVAVQQAWLGTGGTARKKPLVHSTHYKVLRKEDRTSRYIFTNKSTYGVTISKSILVVHSPK